MGAFCSVAVATAGSFQLRGKKCGELLSVRARSEGLFTTEDEEKENKSRTSRQNKSPVPALL